MDLLDVIVLNRFCVSVPKVEVVRLLKVVTGIVGKFNGHIRSFNIEIIGETEQQPNIPRKASTRIDFPNE